MSLVDEQETPGEFITQAKVDLLVDQLVAPPRPRLGFLRRIKWYIDPYYCCGIRHDRSACRHRVAALGDRCWDCYVDIVRQGTQAQKILLAGEPDLPLPFLQRLATDGTAAVRAVVAEKAPALPENLQIFLAGDSDNPTTFRAIARRPDVCETAIRVLLNTSDILTIHSLLENPNVERWTIELIADYPDELIAEEGKRRLQGRDNREAWVDDLFEGDDLGLTVDPTGPDLPEPDRDSEPNESAAS